MSVAIGNLGGEIETGGPRGLSGQAEVGQSVGGRLDKTPNAEWFKPAGDAGFSSASPSFRASWQATINAWPGVSRGTNGIECDLEETGTNPGISSAEHALMQKNPQKTASAANGADGPGAVTEAASSNAFAQSEAALKAAPSGRVQPNLASSTPAEHPSGADSTPGAAEQSKEAHRDRVDSRNTWKKQEDAAQTASTIAQTLSSATEASCGLPVPAISVFPAAGSLAQAAGPLTGDTTPLSSMNFARTELAFVRSAGPVQPGRAEAETMSAAGTFANDHAGCAGTVGSHAPAIPPVQALPLRQSEISAAHEATPPSLKAVADFSVTHSGSASPAQSQSSVPGTKDESSTGAGSESLADRSGSNVKADNLPNPESGALEKSKAPSHAGANSAAQSGADTAQAVPGNTPGLAAEHAPAHAFDRENGSTATPTVTLQAVTVDPAAAAARVPAAAAHDPGSSASHAPLTSAMASAASTQDTFSALDHGSSPGIPQWSHASAQHAEAGFRDPDLGWVGVRADLSAGDIHATLIPSSVDAAETLGGHLAGLSAHLTEEHTPVATLSLASPGEPPNGGGLGQHMGQGTEGQAQESRPDASPATSMLHTTGASRQTAFTSIAEGAAPEIPVYPGEMRGTHVSVMA